MNLYFADVASEAQVVALKLLRYVCKPRTTLHCVTRKKFDKLYFYTEIFKIE